jgi:hypothetical protein
VEQTRISAKYLERRGAIPACSSLCYIRGTWLHTKATVTLSSCVLEGRAVQLDQLRPWLNRHITTKEEKIEYLEVHSSGANALIGHFENVHDFQLGE